MKLNGKVEIVGANVVLIPYMRHHVEKYHQWMSSAELQQLTASDSLSLEEEYDMQQTWRQDDDKCTFIVLDKQLRRQHESDIKSTRESDVMSMIGDTNIFLNDPQNLTNGEIEIMIAEPSSRGCGRGKEATLLMLRYGVEQLNIKSYQAKIGYTNQPSVNMFKKFGFTESSRSEVFREITLSVCVTDEWLRWLNDNTSFTIVEYNASS